MKKFLLIFTFCAVLTSCSVSKVSSGPLYYWGGRLSNCSAYEEYAYRNYKKQSPESTCQMLCTLEDMTSHPGGTRQVPPPGICAEYGFMLLTPGMSSLFTEHATAAQKKYMGENVDYNVLFARKGEEMLLKEISYYPESEKFIKPLVKKLVGK